MKDLKKKRWSDYLWIAELCYLFLGLFNILFAWLGMLFFCIPLLVAIFGGSKAYCNRVGNLDFVQGAFHLYQTSLLQIHNFWRHKHKGRSINSHWKLLGVADILLCQRRREAGPTIFCAHLAIHNSDARGLDDPKSGRCAPR